MGGEIVFLYGWGPEEEGRLSSLLYLAETAAAMNMNVAIFFFGDAVVLAKKGICTKMGEEVGRRFTTVLKNGNIKFCVCEEAARKRSITKEGLEEGTTIVGYATFLGMAVSSKTVITI